MQNTFKEIVFILIHNCCIWTIIFACDVRFASDFFLYNLEICFSAVKIIAVGFICSIWILTDQMWPWKTLFLAIFYQFLYGIWIYSRKQIISGLKFKIISQKKKTHTITDLNANKIKTTHNAKCLPFLIEFLLFLFFKVQIVENTQN